MKLLTTLVLGSALVLSANSYAGQSKTVAPKKMTTKQLDQFSAGCGFESVCRPAPRTIKLGRYSLVFDGKRWSRVKNF